MSFGGFILTNLGRQELAKAEMGQQLVFDYVAVGDGSSSGSAAALDALSHELYRLPILSVSRDGDTVIVDAELSNDKLEAGFYFREIGLFANGVLYAYDNAGQDAEYIDAAGSAVAKLKRIRIALKLSSAVGVMVKMEPGLYALYSDLRDANAEIEELKEGKVDKVVGKGLSANDFTDEEKGKLAGVAPGAEVNVQADWNVADAGSDAFIKNKPVIPTVPAALKNPQALTFTGGVTGAYDGSAAKSVAIPAAGTTSPKVAGTASAGTAATFSRSDHVHPLQTSVSGSSGSCTGNAATATKAAQDGNGNVIADTYLKSNPSKIATLETNKLTTMSNVVYSKYKELLFVATKHYSDGRTPTGLLRIPVSVIARTDNYENYRTDYIIPLYDDKEVYARFVIRYSKSDTYSLIEITNPSGYTLEIYGY